MAKKKEITVENKLRALYDLQLIDSRVDTIRSVRGELPLEVQDLEDEVAGLTTRLGKLTDSVDTINEQIKMKKNLMEEAKVLIKKYTLKKLSFKN
jgi:SHS2 domain-containing protein